jgi:hypothetical protein
MVNIMGTPPNRKAKNLSVFQTLSLMIAFATLMILVSNNNDKK